MGSGPHVLRGMQWYHGHLIAYSVGNFSGYNTLGLDSYTSVSAVLHVTLTASGSFVRGSITPLRLGAPGIPQRDPAGTAISFVNTLSQQDFGGNGAVRLTAAGRIEQPRRLADPAASAAVYRTGRVVQCAVSGPNSLRCVNITVAEAKGRLPSIVTLTLSPWTSHAQTLSNGIALPLICWTATR